MRACAWGGVASWDVQLLPLSAAVDYLTTDERLHGATEQPLRTPVKNGKQLSVEEYASNGNAES
jgi:hypothetical protein